MRKEERGWAYCWVKCHHHRDKELKESFLEKNLDKTLAPLNFCVNLKITYISLDKKITLQVRLKFVMIDKHIFFQL